MRWRAVVDAVADVVWPPSCAVCDEVIDGPGAFCDDCASEVVELPALHCAQCAEPGAFVGGRCQRCSSSQVPFERAFAPFEHEGAVARAIHRMKYEDQSHLARSLGLLLAHTAREALHDMPGTLVPLPLHETRFRERKFDQAALLGHAVAEATGRPLALGWLSRVRDTPRQVGLEEAQREANVSGAFAASPAVQGAEVVLIDDVLTSGATAREAARTLRAAGATRIFVLTIARARSTLRSR